MSGRLLGSGGVPSDACPMSGKETSTMMRLRPTTTVKPLKKRMHFYSCCSSGCCSDLNATTVVYFVSLKPQERKKERRFCPQYGEPCRSMLSSDINIGLAFRLVRLFMHSFQHNTRIYHRSVPLNFFVCVTLFQNELVH